MKLLQPQGNSFLLTVKGKNLHRNFLALLKNIRGFGDSPPGNIRHMEQSVDASQIDKNPVVRDIFDDPFHNAALGKIVQRGFLFLFALGSHNRSTGKHDIVAFAVILQNVELQRLADELVQILDRTDIDLRTGQESDDADIDGKASLDLLHNGPFYFLIVFADVLDFIPDFQFGRFLPGQDQISFGIPFIDKNFYVVADGNIHVSLGVFQFLDGNKPLRFPTHIHHYRVRGNLHNFAAGDIAVLQLIKALLIKFLKAHILFFGLRGRVCCDGNGRVCLNLLFTC